MGDSLKTQDSQLSESHIPMKVLALNQENSNNNVAKSDQNSKKSIAKCLILDWCSYCTAHGISNISRAKNNVTLAVWICFYLASIVFCAYNIINIIVEFSQYNVLINIELINESPIDFPAVTVCNLNPFDKTKANSYIDKLLEKNNISYVKDITRIDIEPDLIYKLIKSNVIANLSKEERAYLGFSLEYMKLSCRFNDFNCEDSDFVSTYNFDYGNCFTFNSGYNSSGNKVPIKKISEAGSDKSFRLELYLGDESFQSEFLLNSGARVIVHNQSVTPLFESEGRDVASGYLTNIGIVRSFFYKLDSPYSDCVKKTRSPSSFTSYYY